jgi:hypothetical protein
VKRRTAELIAEVRRCLVKENRVCEFWTSIPMVAELVSSKLPREIELQFDVEAMGGDASDEG